MNDKTIELNKWLQILLLVTLLFTNAISLDLSAADAEKDADAVEEKPVKQEEPVEPLELRNDRIIAKQLTEGETKWLKVGKSEFLGIFKSDNSCEHKVNEVLEGNRITLATWFTNNKNYTEI